MNRPPIITPASVEVADARLSTLSNGVRLYTLASQDFEVLRVTFVFNAGSTVQDAPFTASAVANLLAEGTARMTALEIAEKLDYHGSWFDVNIDRDNAYISFCTLSKFFDQTMEVASEILLHPLFPQKEMEVYCQKRKQRLAIERTKVDSLAREEFAGALFGKRHPYGVSYPEAAYDDITRSSLEAFYRAHYTAGDCFVVCSGRVGEHETEVISRIASALPPAPEREPLTLPRVETRHRVFIPHTGAVQSAIRIGRLLFPRQHPDFTGMQVVATALGGYFGSRLMRNLREENGYTYGVMAAMVNFQQSGYFAIATQVGSDVTREALDAIHAEIELLRREPVPEEELDLVKNMMIGEMMRILDGPFGIADVTIENILCGTDNRSIDRQISEIRSMTPEDIQRLASKYLDPEEFVTVVVGDDSVGEGLFDKRD